MAGGFVTAAVGVTRMLGAVDADDGVTTDVATNVAADGAFGTTGGTVAVLGAVLPVTAGEDGAGGLTVALASGDDAVANDRPDGDFACLEVSPAGVVSAVFSPAVDALGALGSAAA